jgi:hypothetical protein
MDTPSNSPVRERGRSVALRAGTGAFSVCCAASTIFSISGAPIKRDLDLSNARFSLLASFDPCAPALRH